MHCASLGEFEQGRPLLEMIKATYPNMGVILTFFSPSGYEIRKDYELADIVSYLPLDTDHNAKRFIEICQPQMAIFVKYDLWYHHIHRTIEKHIPVYLISAHFPKGHWIFRSYFKWMRELLQGFAHIFVQDETSIALLNNKGIMKVSQANDTRFDRVASIAEKAENT